VTVPADKPAAQYLVTLSAYYHLAERNETVSMTVTALDPEIFNDGFEVGDTRYWSDTVP
jgi:hypothetical protein